MIPLFLILKARVDRSLTFFVACMQCIPQIHLCATPVGPYTCKCLRALVRIQTTIKRAPAQRS